MPLDMIYVTRHGHRLNWTIDFRTGTYKAQFPTPTGNPADPILTSHGVRQSHELAAHIASSKFYPKPFRIYSSPYCRCLQTIQPSVEALKAQKQQQKQDGARGLIDEDAELDVRIESGLGEWFGPTTFFNHPTASPASELYTHFPSILTDAAHQKYKPLIHPSTLGETIAQLHNRLATALAGIIADVDAEISAVEAHQQPHERTSKAILICSHAAPLIAIGRALTGNMPDDSSTEDFAVFTAGLSTFTRRKRQDSSTEVPLVGGSGHIHDDGNGESVLLAEGTNILRGSTSVPDWKNGRGVGDGWDCVANGDCSFLSGGAERGWHFNGEEHFHTGPMAPQSETSGLSSVLLEASRSGTKL